MERNDAMDRLDDPLVGDWTLPLPGGLWRKDFDLVFTRATS